MEMANTGEKDSEVYCCMKNTRVCQRCKLKDTHVDDMKYEIVGNKKKIKKFYHNNCFDEHINEKEFRKQESIELDSLKATIENIYEVRVLPHQAYPFLQKLRNGEDVFKNQQTGKRYKQGYKYSVIEETFKFCEKDIRYWNSVKNFNGFVNSFMYGLAIVVDKIHYIEERVNNREKNEIKIEKHFKENKHVTSFESNYKKPKKDLQDLSDYLD